MLRGAQRAHTRGRVPWALAACEAAIKYHNVADAIAQKRKSDRKSALPGADDQHIIDVLAGWMLRGTTQGSTGWRTISRSARTWAES